MSRASLDWSDPNEVAFWLAGLRSAFDDADAVASDMLLHPRARQLGPNLHAKNYTEAREAILHALNFASAPEPNDDDGAPSDPAGNGGAGPTH